MLKIERIEQKALLLTDLVAINLCTLILFFTKFGSGNILADISVNLTLLSTIMAILSGYWLTIFWIRNLYRSFYHRSIIEILIELLGTAVIGALLISVIIDISEQSFSLEKRGLLGYFILFVLIVGASRALFKLILNYLLGKNIGLRNSLIVGCNPNGDRIYKAFQKGNLKGLNVVGYIDLEPQNNALCLGSIADLTSIINQYKIREILIALSPQEDMLINQVISTCKGRLINFKTEPSLTDIISGHFKSCEILDYPLMELFPEVLSPFQSIVKRVVDIFVALTILILTLPLMVVTAIVIRLESPGKAIYTQKRVGKDFKEFTVYKFRSMCSNAEAKTGAVWASKNDARITRIGKFLRKTRIDELPQLFNVLIGNMSFVGPRPERKVFVDQFMETIPFYYKRLQVKPGLTGWAQVKHKYDESFDDVKEKLKYDLFYIENMSLKLDLIIMLNTVSVVVMQKGQ